jgi:hypothetical protein
MAECPALLAPVSAPQLRRRHTTKLTALDRRKTHLRHTLSTHGHLVADVLPDVDHVEMHRHPSTAELEERLIGTGPAFDAPHPHLMELLEDLNPFHLIAARIPHIQRTAGG